MENAIDGVNKVKNLLTFDHLLAFDEVMFDEVIDGKFFIIIFMVFD